jgi:hypothetical protein
MAFLGAEASVAVVASSTVGSKRGRHNFLNRSQICDDFIAAFNKKEGESIEVIARTLGSLSHED